MRSLGWKREFKLLQPLLLLLFLAMFCYFYYSCRRTITQNYAMSGGRPKEPRRKQRNSTSAAFRMHGPFEMFLVCASGIRASVSIPSHHSLKTFYVCCFLNGFFFKSYVCSNSYLFFAHITDTVLARVLLFAFPLRQRNRK